MLVRGWPNAQIVTYTCQGLEDGNMGQPNAVLVVLGIFRLPTLGMSVNTSKVITMSSYDR